jgi:hypothetical protein
MVETRSVNQPKTKQLKTFCFSHGSRQIHFSNLRVIMPIKVHRSTSLRAKITSNSGESMKTLMVYAEHTSHLIAHHSIESIE